VQELPGAGAGWGKVLRQLRRLGLTTPAALRETGPARGRLAQTARLREDRTTGELATLKISSLIADSHFVDSPVLPPIASMFVLKVRLQS
jgi:hypothetical protein